jgi:glycosyltransferase involved in cell wall biosynthesis
MKGPLDMRVTLAHDYLTQLGGAERVALTLAQGFPDAPLLTSVYNPAKTFPEFSSIDVRTSVLQGISAFRHEPRLALPLLPWAWSTIDVPPTDVIIASSSGWSHGIAPMSTPVVVYCHNPARWLYQPHDYLRSRMKRRLFTPMSTALQRWDRRAARRATRYLANSTAVARRIRRTYGIDAAVVHPPIGLDPTGPRCPVEGLEPGFWLTVGRGRGYKNTEIVIEAVERLGGQRVVVVGAGEPTENSSRYVTWLPRVSDDELRWLYANARALVSVADEDFGLTPLEANAFGKPVAVLRAGGFLDSLDEGVSGVFIPSKDVSHVAETLRTFPDLPVEPILRHAARFSPDAFIERIRAHAAEVAFSGEASGGSTSS